MSKHAQSTFYSKYFASNNDWSLAISGQWAFDIKTHPATFDVETGKMRQCVLLRLQNPRERGKWAHLPQPPELHKNHPSSPRYRHHQNLALSPLNIVLIRGGPNLQAYIKFFLKWVLDIIYLLNLLPNFEPVSSAEQDGYIGETDAQRNRQTG